MVCSFKDYRVDCDFVLYAKAFSLYIRRNNASLYDTKPECFILHIQQTSNQPGMHSALWEGCVTSVSRLIPLTSHGKERSSNDILKKFLKKKFVQVTAGCADQTSIDLISKQSQIYMKFLQVLTTN